MNFSSPFIIFPGHLKTEWQYKGMLDNRTFTKVSLPPFEHIKFLQFESLAANFLPLEPKKGLAFRVSS